MKNILVPTINTINPNLLLYAKKIATQNNAKLIVLQVTSPLSLTHYYTYPSMLYSIANMSMETMQISQETFANNVKEILGSFPHETLYLVGPTTDTILHVANQKNIDLIIMQGLSNKQKLDKLAKKTNIPIEIFTE